MTRSVKKQLAKLLQFSNMLEYVSSFYEDLLENTHVSSQKLLYLYSRNTGDLVTYFSIFVWLSRCSQSSLWCISNNYINMHDKNFCALTLSQLYLFTLFSYTSLFFPTISSIFSFYLVLLYVLLQTTQNCFCIKISYKYK